jgi:hypothetical protein
MKQVALDALAQKLRQQTGLDLATYRNQALFDTMAEVVLLPKYAGKLVLVPILGLLAVAVGVAGFFFFRGQPWLAVASLGLGGLAGLVNGLLWGILRFLGQLGRDLGQIGQLTAVTAGQILADLDKLANQKSLVQLPKVSEVVLASAHLVVLPGVSRALARKVPVVGGALGAIVATVVGSLAEQLATRVDGGQAKVQAKLDERVAPRAQAVGAYSGAAIQQLNQAVASSSGFSGRALRVAAVPFRVALWLTASLSSLGLGLLWWLG